MSLSINVQSPAETTAAIQLQLPTAALPVNAIAVSRDLFQLIIFIVELKPEFIP